MKFRTLRYMTEIIVLSVLAIPDGVAQCTRCGAYEVIVAPHNLTFSSRRVGTTSPPQTVGVLNDGIETTAVTQISITEPFSQTNDCPSELRRGEHCEIEVRFEPRAAEKVTGQLTVEAAGVHGVALAGSGTLPSAALASPDELAAKKHTHYTLIDLGTFGGPQSYVYIPNNYAPVLNNQGTVVGYADTPAPDPFQNVNFCFVDDCQVTNAFETRNGAIEDLYVLPGGDSSAAGWISPNGLIAGWSQNGTTDPTFSGFPVTHGVLWKDGKMTDLNTLPDGFESVALAVNSSGLVVGAADNSIADPDSMFFDNVYGWATQTRAFVWRGGVMKDIGTLGGTDAAAFLINARGQVVGASYTSSAPSAYCAKQLGASLTTGAFLYEDGEIKNLGGFGGTCTFPSDLNERGEVVGLSTVKGDAYQHAFLWKSDSFHELPNMIGGNNGAAIALNNNGEAAGWASLPGDQAVHASIWKNNSMTDIGTLGEDPCSLGFSINTRGQVVGVSGNQQDLPGCNSGNSIRAFLWEGGSLVDLNTLIPPQSSLYLTTPETINDLGEIAGIGVDAIGNQHAFLLVPCDDDDPTWQDASGETSPVRVSNMPTQHPGIANARRLVRKLPLRQIVKPQQ